MARLKAIIAIILLVGLGECARDLTKCVVCKKKTITWSKQKRRRPALTYTSYYQISSPHLTWTTARVYVVPGGLRWPHQSLNKVQKRLLLQVNTFNFLCFEIGKEENY